MTYFYLQYDCPQTDHPLQTRPLPYNLLYLLQRQVHTQTVHKQCLSWIRAATSSRPKLQT